MSNILVVKSPSEQAYSIRLSFENNIDRDVSCLILKAFLQKFSQAPAKMKELGERDFYKKKEAIWSKELQSIEALIEESKQKLQEFANNKLALEESVQTISDLKDGLLEYKDTSLGSVAEVV